MYLDQNCESLFTSRESKSMPSEGGGFELSIKTMVCTSIVSFPSWTAVSKSGSMVSSPGNPGGGFSVDFS